MAESDRFSVSYQVTTKSLSEAEKLADEIAVEQTAEMPVNTLPKKIKMEWTGFVRKVSQLSDTMFQVTVDYPLVAAGNDITQCLNLLFGNISLKPGIRIADVDWPTLSTHFSGPSYGIPGLRKLLHIPNRALSCTPLKPMGLNFAELADLAHRFAMGGIDIIKDDHSLANQEPAPFVERVKAVVAAIRNAANKTGKKSAYFPNITGDGIETWRRCEIAQELGADGVLVIPQLTGLSALSSLTESKQSLPVMAHPAFAGSYVLAHDHGFTPACYFGSLWRALGADAVIYPNVSGRFSFSEKQCSELNLELRKVDSPFRPVFPVPAGGFQRDTIKEWIQTYRSDTIYLMGGSLYQHPNGIESAAREFQHQVEEFG